MQDRFETVATDYKIFFDLIIKNCNFSFPFTRSPPSLVATTKTLAVSKATGVNGLFKGECS